ncbi:Trp biosynthesis-associated membrane protein [Oerskovia sp. Sa1BUA8]|uniref:Trp biosynthesis-associated membrane protein n=1 Tax=Oerskovia douganii TaxID=2762210 RepID=A0A9D5UBF9_9CELL|nr:Trp biosynthesis-associated membrane protein [Oerskovia douganii]MBE7702018.1 Trp biosynthesis-associated membrane protein [Oerskovia douganii]
MTGAGPSGGDAGAPGAAPAPRAPRSWRLARRSAILLLLVLGAGALAAAAPTWLRTSGSTALDAEVLVQVTGTSAAPGVGAGALVVVASALALGLVGRIGRWLVLAVTVASGVVVAASAAAILRDPTQAARTAVAEATGVPDMTSGITLTPWPYVACAVGVLVVVAALWTGVSSPSWARVSARHEIVRPDAASTTGPTTSGAGSTGRPTGAGDARGGVTSPTGTDGGADDGPDEQETWDSLTRGEDPTDR